MSSLRIPALFIGHGSPMNAIEDNSFSQVWQQIAGSFDKPEAIICISAHWEAHETLVTADLHPRTIHDFGGFPRELYEKQYPAPGNPGLAQRIAGMIQSTPVSLDHLWGLDHGTWSVLSRMYPMADIPVIQLSLNRNLVPQQHYDLGRELAPLRDEGVLILGSGNVVHNLGLITWGEDGLDWAIRFDEKVRQSIEIGDHQSLIQYDRLGRDAQLSINSAEHYLPLLYVLGAAGEYETPHFFCESIWGGSLSMRCVLFK